MGGAEITAIRNKVDKVNAKETREAVVKDGVVEGDQVQTKAGSLAELTFSDKSVARLGANAIFTYNSQERLVKIDKGTVLMQTPPGNGGATITSGGVTGAITGTTFLLTASPAKCSDCSQELIPGKGGAAACIAHPDIKQAGTGGFALCVLEGKNSTKVTGPNGVTVEIMPGQMTVVGPSSSGAPKVFVVNLAQILRTSPLIQAFPEPLPSFSAIQQAAIQQQQSGAIKSTGATCLAISADGDILVGESKPPDPGKRVFEMAANNPPSGNSKDNSAKDAGVEDVETAAGGDGGAGGGAPSGGGASETGGGGSSVPSTPNPPVTPPPTPAPTPTPSPTTLPAVVLNASASSKVYDGLFTATVANALLSGIQVGDTVSLQNITTGTFASKNVGTWSVSTSMGLLGTDASKYSLTQPALSATITAKDVTIGSGSAASKVYNGNTAVVVTAGSLNGLVGSEGLGVTAAGTFADKNVGTRTVAATYTLANGSNGGLASNYNLLNPTETLSATITAKALTISAPSVASKVYNGSRAVGVVTMGTLSGFVGSETVTAGGSAADYSSANVGSYSSAINYTLGNGLNGGLASNYSLAGGSAIGVITTKSLSITAPSIASRVYNGSRTAGVVTMGTLSGFVGSETVTASGSAADYSSANVGSYSSAISYTLGNGLNGGLASNYSLAGGSATGVITAKGLSITAPSIASRAYNGSRTVGVVTVGTLSGFVGSETVTVSGAVANYSSANVGSYSSAINYTLGNGLNGGLASNYSLAAGSATGVITAKDVTIGQGNVSGRVYNGTTGAVVTAGSVSGLVSGETLGVTTAMATFVDRNVGTRNVTATYSLTDGANPLHLASNYNLLNPTETLSATITAKALTVSGAMVTAKAYDGTTLATIAGAALEAAIAAGTGTDTDGKPLSVDAVTLGTTTGTFERNLPGTLIPVSTVMSLVGAGSGNYTLTQPNGLKGEITGSANLNRDGASVSVNSADYVHIRNTTATRVQGGLSIQSAGGSVLLENSSFSAWMQKSSGGITLDALGLGVIQFNETAGVVVDKPILGIKMSSVPGGDMFLGDYRLTVSHYPTGTPGSLNDKTVDVLNHTAAALDPIGYGSAANGANLILRDGADSSINSIDYASFDTASGEYKPNSPASGLNSGSSTGLWSFLFSNESLNPNGQVDEVKLKYQEGKAVIRGAQGVEIVNVRFEGMDEVELEAANLGGRVLMSGTLVSDPTISKIAMKALSSVQKSVLTGAGLPNSMDAVEAEINNPNFTGKTDITIAGDRALQIAAINVAGQLALNSHTIVFNNANVTSAGVIDARTRNGVVNRTYGSVVPGTVNFMGAGNNFLNTANNASMSIANSANIVSALNAGHMRENGVGGATVMNVGRR